MSAQVCGGCGRVLDYDHDEFWHCPRCTDDVHWSRSLSFCLHCGFAQPPALYIIDEVSG